ncbi:MAG TPA: PEP-CTERM sorting domain-containing protein [Telluria sp.]|nr:PEP-CTERM sorting domain-containing protein [Telluria sp.]
MSIRHLIVAALAASACAAHADVIQTPAASQSGFLTSWTTGNGTDVLNSGLFSGLNLIGGISNSEASKASASQGGATLADVLYGKASASLGQGADGQTKLYFQQGIEGTYLLGAGHGILAAMLGNGVSVVGSADGVVVSKGQTGAMISSGGGGGSSTSTTTTTTTTTSSGGTTSGSTTGATGSTGNAGNTGNTGNNGNANTGNNGSGSTNSNAGGNAGGTTGGLPGAIISHPEEAGPVLVTLPPSGQGNPGGQQQTPSADVPEPSSIALMLAGMLGAGSVLRRRKR